jgi:hypothetical protein
MPVSDTAGFVPDLDLLGVMNEVYAAAKEVTGLDIVMKASPGANARERSLIEMVRALAIVAMKQVDCDPNLTNLRELAGYFGVCRSVAIHAFDRIPDLLRTRSREREDILAILAYLRDERGTALILEDEWREAMSYAW